MPFKVTVPYRLERWRRRAKVKAHIIKAEKEALEKSKCPLCNIWSRAEHFSASATQLSFSTYHFWELGVNMWGTHTLNFKGTKVSTTRAEKPVHLSWPSCSLWYLTKSHIVVSHHIGWLVHVLTVVMSPPARCSPSLACKDDNCQLWCWKKLSSDLLKKKTVSNPHLPGLVTQLWVNLKSNTKSTDLPVSCFLHLRLQVNLRPWCASLPQCRQRRCWDSTFKASLANGRKTFAVCMNPQTCSANT